VGRAEGVPRVFLVGSSQADSAFAPPAARPVDGPPLAFAKLAHAGIGPFEIRSLVDEVLAYRPAAVVLLLSEFDTHRPLYLRPGASFGSLSAVVDLVIEAGAPFAVAQRNALYRLTVAGLLNGYRYRDVLGRAGLDRLRRFELDVRLPGRPAPESDAVLAGAPSTLLSPAEVDRLLGQVAALPRLRSVAEANQIHSITRGEHARVQMGLLRRAVRILRAAGTQVVVVEGPLHPAATALYDTSIRSDFLAFARSLAAEEGVCFVPLEATEPFGPGDFWDLTHVHPAGAQRITQAALAAVRGVLRLGPPAPCAPAGAV